MRTIRRFAPAFAVLASLLVAARARAQESATLFVPVVVSTSGQSGSFFTSELVETNTGALDATVTYTYTAAAGGGSGTVHDPQPLPARHQRVIPDAIAFLRSLGLGIPAGVNAVGTLGVAFQNLSYASSAAVTVRTTTPVPVGAPTGRAGLAYSGLQPAGLLDGPAFLAGLRQNAQDRTNVAVQNAGSPGDGPITLRLTWIPSGGPAGAAQDVTLDVGGFAQLPITAFDPGATAGTVRVERISGSALYYAYAVVNDQATSDGSFLSPVALRASYAGVSGLVLPTVVETGTYRTEVVVTNLTDAAAAATLTCVSSAFSPATLNVSLGPWEQRVYPDFVQALRDAGAPGIPAPGTTITGTVTLKSSASIGSFALGGRTLNAGGGGRYGVYTAAQPYTSGAAASALLYGLRQDGQNRTNVAVVNMGDRSSDPVQATFQFFDGDTGQLVATVTDPASVPPGGFHQLNSILATYAPATSQGWVLVTTQGMNGAILYAVVNDGASPGQRSGDGAVVPMDPYTVTAWKGNWHNTTFGTTGAAYHTDLLERITQRVELTFTLQGNVFGGTAPPTQVFLGNVPADLSPFTVTGYSPVFGDYTATVDLGGSITASGSNVPSPYVSAFTFSGTVTGAPSATQFDGTYRLTLRPSGIANGTVTLKPVPISQLFP